MTENQKELYNKITGELYQYTNLHPDEINHIAKNIIEKSKHLLI